MADAEAREGAATPSPAAGPGRWHRNLSPPVFWGPRVVWLIGSVLIAVTVLAASIVIWDIRSRATVSYQRDATVLASALAAETTRYIQVIDHVLQEVQDRAAAMDLRTPVDLRTRMATPDMWEFLRQRVQNLPANNAFAVISADGRMVASSRGAPASTADFSQADYMQYFRLHPGDTLFVGATRINRITAVPTVFLARRIDGPDHRLLGVAMAAVDANELTAFHAAVNAQPGQTITLLRRDGLVLTRVPDPTNAVNQVMPAASPWYRIVKAGGGTYRSPGFLGGAEAVVSVSPLLIYPLVVDVAIREHVALAEWRRQAGLIGMATTGAVVGFLVLFRVIAIQFARLAEQNATLRRTAEALRASEQREAQKSAVLAATLEHMDQGLMMVDNDRHVPICNRRAMELLDLPVALMTRNPRFEEVLAWQWSQEEFAGTDEEFRSFVRRALLMQGPTLYERERPNGTVLEVRTTSLPNGEAVRTYTDVTERHRAHAELERARDLAEAASRAKTQFLANMSHEFRTPLNAILGFSELIRDQATGPHADYARDIHASGRHLLELVNDLLDLSKIEAGRYDLSEETVNLHALLLRCERMVAPRARDGQVQLLLERSLQGVDLRIDRQAIRQVLLNLMANAVKFTPAGGIVTVRGERLADGSFAVAIADTGVGIAPEVLPTLFEPFQQADASISRRFGGTGLGLAISRKLMALHGGRLEIASQPGEGTVVQAVFPPHRVIEVPAAGG